MFRLFAMILAFATTITYFDVGVQGGASTFLFLYIYFVIVQAIIILIARKLNIASWARINSRGVQTIALIIFFSFINGLLLLIFAQITNLMQFNNLYQPFAAAASMVLVRQLFD
jgi:hypothetical protein